MVHLLHYKLTDYMVGEIAMRRLENEILNAMENNLVFGSRFYKL
jgi:hypothetical protein